ncbi:MAG: long-chain fatty acid--CoA ligase [Planctomycetota bacterium]|nr:MAG: long-chain fatty acid--CoA ligase [Planctomycetota bacterium]
MMSDLFFSALEAHAQRRPKEVALRWADGVMTWAACAEAVAQRCQHWQRLGLQAGERVALRMTDGPRHLCEALGIMAAGGVHCPIDHSLPASQAAEALESLDPTWWLDDAEGAQGDPWHPGGSPMPGNPGLVSRRTSRQGPAPIDQVAFIRHTSGTTGVAKGVILTHRAIAERADAVIRAIDLRPGDAMAWVLPLAFHFAVSIGACLRSGATVVFASNLRVAKTAAICREAGVTHAYFSPWYAMRLGVLPELNLGSHLREVLVTTAAIDAVAADRLRQRLQVPVRQALGVIEVGLPLVSPGYLGEVAGEFGAPVADYRVRIVDGVGKDCQVGECGELLIAGPGLFAAYLSPFTPAVDILRGDFFPTGDAAALDADGRVRLLGRLKSVIVVAGMKVFPLQVEAVLEAHPAVARALVEGVRDEHTGELVQARIEIEADNEESEADLQDRLLRHCQQYLGALECPSRWIFERLPLTVTGKVQRHR